MRLLKLILTLVLVLFMSGCHGTRETVSFSVPDTFDTSREYELTFWAKNDTNKTQTDIYKKAIEDFQALYPNIKINLRLYTDYGKIYNDVITNIATNTTPNICISYPDHIATYLTGDNVVVPLDDLILDDKYGLGSEELAFSSATKDEMVTKYLEEGKIDGHYYAMPFMRSSEVCYINKTYVEKLGFTLPEKLTWDFIWEVSEAAMAKDENGNFLVNGQQVMIPFIYKSTDNMMIQYLAQANAGYSNENGEVLIFNDTTRDFLKTISEHAQTRAFSTFKISGYPANFLNAGQCIFAIDSTAGATWMGPDAPLLDISEDALVDFETVVMPIPQVDVENPKMISQGPSICIFNKEDPQEVLASWLFLQYLLTNDIQIAYAQTEGYIPVTTIAQEDAVYQQYLQGGGIDNDLHYDIKIDATKILLDNVENTFITPVFNGSTSLRDTAGQLIEETVKSVRRNQNVDDNYFDELFEEVSGLYHLDEINAGDVHKDLGPLPTSMKIMLISLALIWCGIIGGFVYNLYQKKASKH